MHIHAYLHCADCVFVYTVFLHCYNAGPSGLHSGSDGRWRKQNHHSLLKSLAQQSHPTGPTHLLLVFLWDILVLKGLSFQRLFCACVFSSFLMEFHFFLLLFIPLPSLAFPFSYCIVYRPKAIILQNLPNYAFWECHSFCVVMLQNFLIVVLLCQGCTPDFKIRFLVIQMPKICTWHGKWSEIRFWDLKFSLFIDTPIFHT